MFKTKRLLYNNKLVVLTLYTHTYIYRIVLTNNELAASLKYLLFKLNFACYDTPDKNYHHYNPNGNTMNITEGFVECVYKFDKCWKCATYGNLNRMKKRTESSLLYTIFPPLIQSPPREANKRNWQAAWKRFIKEKINPSTSRSLIKQS